MLYNALKRLSTGYSAAERAAMFQDTATPRLYRIVVYRAGAADADGGGRHLVRS